MNEITPTKPGEGIKILHISDLHIRSMEEINKYYSQIQADLDRELDIKKLDYCVISGDVAHHSTPEEYKAALHFLTKLNNKFGLEPNNIIIVPGNHDLNWDLAENAYDFLPQRKITTKVSEKKENIKAGDVGYLIRDDKKYLKRFDHFNEHFFKEIYQKDYPQDYSEQWLFSPHPEDRILFLGLNSAWDINSYHKDPDRINMDAVAKALEKVGEHQFDEWLKVLVLHHPVIGKEMINNEFLDLLNLFGFQICLHGHIHEAIDDYHKPHNQYKINIVGAGTFGAPTCDRPEGIPLQYNLLVLNPTNGQLVVNTRKREKRDGAWGPDHRWGKKNDLKPWYVIDLNWHRNDPDINIHMPQSVGMPDNLISRTRVLLSQCDEFKSHEQFVNFIKLSPLSFYTPKLKQNHTVIDRVDQSINDFYNLTLSSGDNSLVIIVNNLAERYHPNDSRHGQLKIIAKEIKNNIH